MASDTDEKETPSATHAIVPESHEPGPSTSASEGNNNIRQETAKNTEGVRTKPAFPWKLPDEKKGSAYTLQEKDKAIKNAATVVRAYSDEMIKRWNEEIDNLLVYAGLFSAILTAFNVQSYILLQPSTPDPTLLMLQQISQQLHSFSVTPTGVLVNSSHPVNFMPVQAPPVERWAIWLNSLWFSGLIFSLASASIGIMVKQWIHEYQAGISGDSPEIARLRQYRLNHLEKWHVAEIVAFLPVLLQIALFLFFSGLLVLLWHYHSTVATVASVLIGLVALFVVGTTIMPIIWSDCCYLSPPVYLLFSFAQHLKYGLVWLGISTLWTICYELLLGHPATGMKLLSTIINDPSLKRSTWRGRERVAIQSASTQLHIDMTIHAYSTTIDIRHLSDAGAILASHGADAFHRLYTEIQKINEQHFGQKDFDDSSAELWAGHSFHLLRQKESLYQLWTARYSYHDNPDLSLHNQFLVLLVDVSKGDKFALKCLDTLFTFNPDALKLMPWNTVRRVAAVVETELCQRLRPRDDDHSEWIDWDFICWALRVLVQCSFAPVSSWERSPRDMGACMQYILGLDFLQKESLQKIAYEAIRTQTLTLILTYLGESADAWGCRSAAEDFMEAVRTVIEMFETEDWLKEKLPPLKDSFRKCESLFANRSQACLTETEQETGIPKQ